MDEGMNTWERRKRVKRMFVPPPEKIHREKKKYNRKNKYKNKQFLGENDDVSTS